MNFQERFAARLKRERIQANKTMAEFSRELGISLSSLEEYESGRRLPRLDTLVLIAKNLGVPVTEFFLEDGISDTSTGAYLDTLSIQVASLHGPARRVGEGALDMLRDAFSASPDLEELKEGKPPRKETQGKYHYALMTLREPGRRQNAYGLLAKERRGDQWVSVAAAAPFSTDRSAVLQIAEKCNALQLSPIHILDVVMDTLKQAEG